MRKQKILALSLLFSGIVIGFLISAQLGITAKSQGEPSQKDSQLVSSVGKIEDAVISVASVTGKAVVSISAERTTRVSKGRFSYGFPERGSMFPEDEFFRRFFDDFFEGTPYQEFKQMGLGSGVIIDPDGYVLTNEHVVSDADKITVTLPDGREFKAAVKGRDMRSDLAVIKIDAHNLPVAKLGDSDALKIGQWVIAIGNPFGFALQNPEPTVTVGVVSAMHRSLGRSSLGYRDYNDLIQTDAAINPGNSGGPLVNLNGEVVGINVAIFSTSGGYQGVGFAIPINSATRVISRLIEGKKIQYGWLGVTVQDLNEDLVNYFSLPDKNGVLVAKVLEGGPAQKAGVKESDVIIRFDNTQINNVRELLSVVGKAEVGRKVDLTLIRDKKTMVVNLVVGERPEEKQLDTFTQPQEEEEAPVAVWRGLEVEELSPETAKKLRIQEQKGMLVVRVEPGSPADDAGIIRGDVIIEISRKPVNNISDYKKATSAAKGSILLKTARGYFILKEKTAE